MMHPFMTLSDGTEIVHSDLDDSGRVKVYIEKQRMLSVICIAAAVYAVT